MNNQELTEENALTRERRRNNLSIVEVADQLGLHHSTVNNWESGHVTVPLHHAEKLYRIYNLSKEKIDEIQPLITRQWRSKYDPPVLGKKYGEFTVIEDYTIENKNTKDQIKVKCSCGVIKDVEISYLILGQSKSCGHRTDQFKQMMRSSQIQKPSVYLPLIGVQNHFNDQYTLNYFTDDNRSKRDVRLYTYELECKCGRTYQFKDSGITPREYSKRRKCICEYSNSLKKQRIKNKLTKEQVAKKFDISIKHVDIWENLAYDIHIDDLNNLYDLYNTPNTIRGFIRQYKESVGALIIKDD